MRIVHVIVDLDVGGAERMLQRVVTGHLNATAFEHEIVSLTDIGQVGKEVVAAGVPVRALGMTRPSQFPTTMFRLTRLLTDLRPDIVQCWMYHADLLGGLAAYLSGHRNIIWGIRTTDVTIGGAKMTYWIARLCAQLSSWLPTRIVCVAEAAKRRHIALGYDPRRMIVIPNGFNEALYSAAITQRESQRELLGFATEDRVIGTLGRYHAVKDPENFVRACARVAAVDRTAQFLMVGRDFDRQNVMLLKAIDATGFGHRFTLLGERTDVPACLSAMDIFCLSSRTEGFPNAVGEAMAAGLPCVVTDVGDAALLLADCGVVVPKEDSAALADGLTKLLSLTSGEFAELKFRAAKRITENFTIERIQSLYEDLYLTLELKRTTECAAL